MPTGFQGLEQLKMQPDNLEKENPEPIIKQSQILFVWIE
jgi:hypothetical protein